MTPNAVGYARISQEDQSVTSLEDQPILIREYCERNGLQLAHIYVENGKSAFTFDRPQWRQLEAHIRTDKNIKYIVVKHIDRFSRADLVDALIKIREIEVKLGVKIVSVKDDIHQDSGDLGFKLLRTIELLMSNNERNRIQERTKDGTYRTLANGRWPSLAPYGYRNARDADERPVLEIDEIKAANVRKAFELFSNGVSAFEIARRLGFAHKHRSFVTELLQRKIYAGIVDVPAYKGKPAYETTSVNPPIVSKSLFYQVQNLLNRKGNKFHGNSEVWLRGLLRCHDCGRLMTAGKSRGTGGHYWYYKCGVHRKNLSANKLHSQYYEILRVCSIPEQSLTNLRTHFTNLLEQQKKNRGGDYMRLNVELGKIKKRIEVVQENFLDAGNIDKAVYDRKINELKKRETEIEEQLVSLKDNSGDLSARLDEILSLLADLPTAFNQWETGLKQKFVAVQLAINLTHSGQLFYSDFLHPVFSDKAERLNELRLLKLKTPAVEVGGGLLSTPEQAAGQLLDFLFMTG